MPESSTYLADWQAITLSRIPEEWEVRRLDQIVEILDHMRVPISSEERSRRLGAVPYYGANGQQGWIDHFLFDEPLILVAEDGGNFDDFATRPIAYRISGKSWVNNHAHILRASNGNSLDFIFLTLAHRDIRRYIAGSTRSKLTQRELRSIEISAPVSPSEQSRIAAVLDTVDEAIAKTEAVIAKLKQVRAGLLHDLLTRGLDEQGQLRDPIVHPEQFQDSPLGRIPREWTVGSLDGTIRQPSDLTIGPFGSNLLASDYRSEGAPVVFVRDVREDGFVWNSNIYVSKDKADELRAHSVFAGDVLITKMGLPPCIAAVYPSTMPRGVVTADVIRLRPQVDVVTSFWLAAYINSPRFAACVRQITGGVTRPKVTLTDFRKQPVLLPSVDEQKRIENIVMAMARGIEEVEAESQKLLMLKSGLMADLLTGRVRVPEHFGVRRHDAALSSYESGDVSPHSKDTSLHSKGNVP